MATRGIARIVAPSGAVRLRVQAGEPWDDLVAYTVEHGWSGLEALSGIPGSTGASPIQNIGAYGQEVGDSLVSVDFLDYGTGRVERIARDELELGYRTSVFKRGKRGVVLSVTFSLTDAGTDASALGDPIVYPQLAQALGVSVGDRVPLVDVRRAVLTLRASKGMVLDTSDPDSVSLKLVLHQPDRGRELRARPALGCSALARRARGRAARGRAARPRDGPESRCIGAARRIRCWRIGRRRHLARQESLR